MAKPIGITRYSNRRVQVEEDTVGGSEAELRERDEEQRAEAEKPGAGRRGKRPLFLPAPDFMASAGEQ